MSQSVVALLFSPEEILREEAALLITRSGMDIYAEVSERIPDTSRKKLDMIISGTADPEDLAYSKALFLSSCFEEINEDDLLSLANEIIHIPKENQAIETEDTGFIGWLFKMDNSGYDFKILYENFDRELMKKELNDEFSFIYLLPFKAIDSFSFQYPEYSWKIMKYIDDNEK